MEFEAEVTRDSIASLDRAVSDMQDSDALLGAFSLGQCRACTLSDSCYTIRTKNTNAI